MHLVADLIDLRVDIKHAKLIKATSKISIKQKNKVVYTYILQLISY